MRGMSDNRVSREAGPALPSPVNGLMAHGPVQQDGSPRGGSGHGTALNVYRELMRRQRCDQALAVEAASKQRRQVHALLKQLLRRMPNMPRPGSSVAPSPPDTTTTSPAYTGIPGLRQLLHADLSHLKKEQTS